MINNYSFKCGKEKVIDQLKSLDCQKGILKIYKKRNSVIYLGDIDNNEYIQWTNDSGNKELIDMVNKKL